jgi:hypothetical protein
MGERALSTTRRKLTFLMTLILLSIALFPKSAFAEQADAETAIASAKQEIVACYQAAMEAEGAGANITSLTAVLNDAGMLLSQSELAYSKNDFDVAREFAAQIQQKLGDVISNANVLKDSAVQRSKDDFLVNIVGSVVGVFVVIGAGLATWFLLNKRNKTSGVQANDSSRL